MSAQTLLSVLAPTVPTAVASGMSDTISVEDRAAFESLLSEGDMDPETDQGEEATVSVSVTAAPTPAPTPPPVLIPPVAPPAPPQVDMEAEGQPTLQPPASTPPDLPEPTAPAAPAAPAAPPTASPSASAAIPAAAPNALATTAPVEPETAPPIGSAPEDSADQPSPPPAQTPPSTPAASSLPGRPIPPPTLRERHAASGERLAAGAMESSANPAATPAASSSGPTGTAPAVGAAPAPSPGAAPQLATAALAAADAPSAEPDGQAAPPAPETQGPAAAGREVSLSGLSRGAIETTAQIAAQIVRRLEGRSTRFDMALTPEHLGRVDVSLEIAEDGRLAARLAFDNPAAATDLRGRADELRRQLQDAGFQLADDALEFTERHDQPGADGFERRPDRRAFASASRLAVEADIPPPAPSRWASLSLTPERVDLKV